MRSWQVLPILGVFLHAQGRHAITRASPASRTRLLPAQLSYPFATRPEPATVKEVAPGVLWLRMPLPFALNHINLWALEDEGSWTLVDTGIADDTTRGLWDQLFSGPLAGRKV